MNSNLARRAVLTVASVTAIAVGVSTAGASTAANAESHDVRHAYVAGSKVASGGEVHGVVLTQGNRPFDANLAAIPQLAADGVNTVDLYVTEYQANATSDSIGPGLFTPSTTEVEAAITLAHSYGMAVELVPIVWTSGTFAYRLAYYPTNIPAWFASYKTMIDQWAQVAQETDTEIFSMGSEYSVLEKFTSNWVAIAKSIRSIYSGKLTYMSTSQAIFRAKFYRVLDYIGVSPYYDVSDAQTPSVSSMVKAWRTRYLPKLHQVSKRWGKPILFDELGYGSVDYAASKPYTAPTGTPNETAQANAYQAAIDVTHDVPWLKGVVFFTVETPELAPSIDVTYSPLFKQAECVMAESWAPASDTTPTACEISSVLSL